MALSCNRLLSNSIRSQIRLSLIVPARSVTINPEPAKDVPYEGHDIRNLKLNRPLSPHVTIYKFPIAAYTSITHRITGLALSGYVVALGTASLVLPHDVVHYLTMLEGLHLSPATMFAAKAVIAFPFAYHLANGMRHLIWDTGKLLTRKELYSSAYVMIALSVLLTAALAAL